MRLYYASAVFFLTLGSSQAADIDNGDDLHFTNCTGCHDESVYTRDNRRVSSLPQLGTQVRFCKDSLGLTWFDDEVDDVIGYLNKTYYQF
jgi:hypothetical protein